MMRVMAQPVPERRSEHAADLLAIYDVAVDQVYRYHRARCGHRQLAEDLTAETFLAAVGQIQRGRVDEVTVAWLIGIARHKLVDHWRRLDRQPRRFDAPSGDLDPDVATDEWTPEVLERRLVEDVMSQLGSHHREALVLRYFDGLAVPEVARTLGRTVHATETLLVRARRQFRLLYVQAEGSTP
jgi:RNA polymerase sigma-70 factor (ECF subfamily)